MDEDEVTGRRMQRLTTLASLARPVQHEINNLLTVVIANLELLKRTAAEGGPQRQLDRILQATRRLETSTRGLLSLARRPVPDEAEVAPLTALQALQPLLQVVLPAATALVVHLPEAEPWRTRLDRAAFDETLIALACEAGASSTRKGPLELALNQEGGTITLVVTWPEGAPPPSPALTAALAGLGAETLPDGRWVLRWSRLAP
jgi:signal transduction histidine kinase